MSISTWLTYKPVVATSTARFVRDQFIVKSTLENFLKGSAPFRFEKKIKRFKVVEADPGLCVLRKKKFKISFS